MSVLCRHSGPHVSLCANVVFAAFHFLAGFTLPSWWFMTIGAYYLVLAAARFFVLCLCRTSRQGQAVMRLAGIMLVLLSVCLAGVNFLSAVRDRGSQLHKILMITMALYAFTRITLAAAGLIRAKKAPSPGIITLSNLSFADAAVSIYTLQRSMLVSFPGMESEGIQLFNVLTGTCVFLIVLLLGINLIGGKYITMAKSNIAKAAERVAKTVTDGYKKIETGVVGGYKKIEQSVVAGYTKLEDKFIDTYLSRECESVEDAKKRLKNKEEL